MSSKKTYAAMMKQLSSKKAQYEKGLEEANRMGNRSGIADYNRRLAKLSAGMDELFQAQEASKAPQGNMMALGGMSKYDLPKAEEGLNTSTLSKKGNWELRWLPMTPEIWKLGSEAETGAARKKGDDGKWYVAQLVDSTGSTRWAPAEMSNTLAQKPEIILDRLDEGGWDAAWDLGIRSMTMTARGDGPGPFGDYANDVNIPGTDMTYDEKHGLIDGLSPLPSGHALDPNTYYGTNAYRAGLADGTVDGNTRYGLTRMPWDGRDNAFVDEQGNMYLGSTVSGPVVMTEDMMKQADEARNDWFWQTKPWDEFINDREAIKKSGQRFHQKGYGVHGQFDNEGRFKPDRRYFDEAFNTFDPPVSDDTPAATQDTTPPTTSTPGTTSTGDATSSTGSSSTSAGAQPSAEAQQKIMDMFGNRLPGGSAGAWREAPLWNDAAGAARINDIPETDPRHPNYVDPNAKVDTSQDGYNIDFGEPQGRSRPADVNETFGGKVNNFLGKNKETLGLLAGHAAQFIPDLMNMREIRNLEGPVDRDMLTAYALNTDLQVGNQLQSVQDAYNRNIASIDQNVSNPAVAAAMKRASQRVAAGQEAQILGNETSTELQLRNQNLQNIYNTINANKDRGWANEQAKVDFENQRAAALNRIRTGMGDRIGAAYTDFANRAADRKRWELMSKLDFYNVAGRNDIDDILGMSGNTGNTGD